MTDTELLRLNELIITAQQLGFHDDVEYWKQVRKDFLAGNRQPQSRNDND